MGLRLYNTLTRTKEEFSPIDPQNIRMYVCGPTVYDFAHIGNARPLIVFDVLFRLLRHLYGEAHVTYVRNITDVDDKINARAAEEYPDLPLNEAIREVTSKTEKQFHEDVAALGCLQPTREPRATEHIAEMKAIIEKLVASQHAYVAEDHVLFHVAAMKDYGKLSNRSLDEMIAGARVEVAPYKRDAMDFVLWKPSKPGEPSWPSPAGIEAPGRPGWHLECSAMSDRWLWQEARATLSEAGVAHPHQFDIHGGGIDLVFPHHENEIAQSRCAHGTPVMANYWLHNGFLQVEGEKMSKSLGNFVTIREMLDSEKFGGQKWPGETLRFAMLATHYRQPIDWTVAGLVESNLTLLSFRTVVSKLIGVRSAAAPDTAFVEELTDDLNSAAAIGRLHQLASEAKGSEAACNILHDTLVFVGLLPDLQIDARHAARIASQYKAQPQTLWTPEGYLSVLRSELPPSANVTSSSGQLIYLVTEGEQTDTGALVRSIDEVKKHSPPDFLVSDTGAIERVGIGEINSRIEARAAARKAKDFAKADRIRAELDRMGIALKDSKDPATGKLVTTWEVKR